MLCTFFIEFSGVVLRCSAKVLLCSNWRQPGSTNDIKALDKDRIQAKGQYKKATDCRRRNKCRLMITCDVKYSISAEPQLMLSWKYANIGGYKDFLGARFPLDSEKLHHKVYRK